MTIFSWLCCFSKKAKKRAADSSEMDLNEPDTSNDAVFPTREQLLNTCLPQEFSLPMSIMEYIWENPSSPELYEKLIKSCKYFFLQNPVIVMYGLDYHYLTGWKYCTGKECDGMFCENEHKTLDMDKLKDNKIWVADRFRVLTLSSNSNIVSDFIPKIFRCNVKILELSAQNLSYDELKFLATGVKECRLKWNTVKHDNGKDVSLEDIVKLFSGAAKFYMDFLFQPNNAFCNSYDDLVEACNTVKEVTFQLIPDIFNVRTFYDSLKRSESHTLFDIYSKSDKVLLDGVMAEILQTQSFAFVPPVIEYSGQDKRKLMKMEEIQEREAAKYL